MSLGGSCLSHFYLSAGQPKVEEPGSQAVRKECLVTPDSCTSLYIKN
jgi:hypothetical protein